MTLAKWKKAVIHLECATDSKSYEDRMRESQVYFEAIKAGKPQVDLQQLMAGSRDIRYQGTGIFLVHESRHYVVTARHVLFDDLEAQRSVDRDAAWHAKASWPLEPNRHDDTIFSLIFRVPTVDEVAQFGPKAPEFLMNLGAGVSWMAPYTFSDAELDLAVISLDQRDKGFSADLLKSGYAPVRLDDFADEPSSDAAELFAVGYPERTSIVGEIARHAAEQHWASICVSVPAVVWGHVSVLHERLAYYWVDMSVYPGNSGGPVIEQHKIVGIVSEQALLQAEHTTAEASYRIPFARVIKAKFVRPLLEIQIRKDSERPGA